MKVTSLCFNSPKYIVQHDCNSPTWSLTQTLKRGLTLTLTNPTYPLTPYPSDYLPGYLPGAAAPGTSSRSSNIHPFQHSRAAIGLVDHQSLKKSI